jgi:ATP-binding cassette subfamily B protein
VFVVSGLDRGVGDVLLVLVAGGRLTTYVGAAVGELGFLRGIWLESSRRLTWLEDFAASHDERADQSVPDRLSRGIRLEHVSFRYPGPPRSCSTTSTWSCRPARSWRSSARTAPGSRRS